MAEIAISLRGLSKHFGAVRAVDDLDLDIADGEFFSMLGPSGSGKTTVLRLIAGFEEPTGGRILLGDEDVTGRPPFARDVNTVFQDYAIFPHMSVLENVEYGLRVKKVGRAERRRRATEALATVRLAEYGARRPHQLSGGQRQRVALARALVNRPKVLLLDEPLGALDLKLRREMQIELKAIQREVGITFVFVTHDQEEALTMSDRIAVFNEGRIEQLASPVELYEQPASAFVAGFVGTSNLLAGGAAQAVVGETGAFSVRPEKIQLSAEAPAQREGLCVAAGVVREVVYLGASTSTVVELDAGPTLTVSHPNTDTTIDAALERRGQSVVLSWRRDHLVPLGPGDPAPTPEEETA
jgi:putative spermidine/putrescine transport system ATP-binding protein